LVSREKNGDEDRLLTSYSFTSSYSSWPLYSFLISYSFFPNILLFLRPLTLFDLFLFFWPLTLLDLLLFFDPLTLFSPLTLFFPLTLWLSFTFPLLFLRLFIFLRSYIILSYIILLHHPLLHTSSSLTHHYYGSRELRIVLLKRYQNISMQGLDPAIHILDAIKFEGKRRNSKRAVFIKTMSNIKIGGLGAEAFFIDIDEIHYRDWLHLHCYFMWRARRVVRWDGGPAGVWDNRRLRNNRQHETKMELRCMSFRRLEQSKSSARNKDLRQRIPPTHRGCSAKALRSKSSSNIFEKHSTGCCWACYPIDCLDDERRTTETPTLPTGMGSLNKWRTAQSAFQNFARPEVLAKSGLHSARLQCGFVDL